MQGSIGSSKSQLIMERSQSLLVSIIIVLLGITHPGSSWYYNCFKHSNEHSILLQDSCSLKDIVVNRDIEAQNIYFPPTNINFFQSNFSSFSPALGRRFPEETKKVNFFNCFAPKFAIPAGLEVVGIFFTYVEKVYSNYELDNQLRNLTILDTRITTVRFVEVFDKLQFLRIENNPIQYVNFECFRNLTQLEVITLSRNQIYNIDAPKTLLQLPKLREFYLDRNYLIELDARLGFFPALQILTLHTNFLKSINVEELSESAPQLQRITLSRNLWNCQRLNVIVRAMMDRNVSTLESDAAPLCQTFDYYEYLALASRDDVTSTKRMKSRLNDDAAVFYEDAKSVVLKDLMARNEGLKGNVTELKAAIKGLEMKYSTLRSWLLKN